jgi:hypothetical protein
MPSAFRHFRRHFAACFRCFFFSPFHAMPRRDTLMMLDYLRLPLSPRGFFFFIDILSMPHYYA